MKMDGETSVETLGERACIDSNGLPVRLYERRHLIVTKTAAGIRRYPGARFWCTGEGAAVRLIDSSMFEVVDSGELLVVME
jgi:hypothetical protein